MKWMLQKKVTPKKNVRSATESESEPTPQKKKRKKNADESPVTLSNHYEYKKIGNLQESGDKESCNVYGIVDKCDLKTTQGKGTKILDLLLTDETEVGFTCSVFAAKDETFPDVYPGDIIRIHRMQVYKFRGKLKGKCPTSKYILVFSKENEGTKPKTVAKSFTFTPDDAERVRELFQWYQKQSEPKCISKIERDDFVNIVCQVIGVYVARTTDAVIVKIWDGTKTNLFPGSHYGYREERLDQKLFTIARSYYVVLSVYGNHASIAGELQPGQYIEVLNAHLYSPKNNPDECKLCLHAGNQDKRGIRVLSPEDNKLIKLKERLDKIVSDLDFGPHTDDLLSENNSIFLNCDISAYNSSQKSVKDVTNSEAPQNENVTVPNLSNELNQDLNLDIEVLNKPLVSKDEAVKPSQSSVVSVLDAAIKPGQATQEFGEGMVRQSQQMEPNDDNRLSVNSEPDPLINMTPVERRFFFHDPLNSANQMSPTFPPFTNATQDEWWKSVPTLSKTDGHEDIKPSSLEEVARHAVPFKFRIFVAVLGFKPETASIKKIIHLYCPECFYMTKDAKPNLEPFETINEIPYFHCPECVMKASDDFYNIPKLEYTYLISFSLHDGTGPAFIEAYLWQENAVKFFKGFTPEQALKDENVATSIFSMLWNICPNCRPFNSTEDSNFNAYPVLDCCILSYSSVDGTRYQMFDTLLT